MIYALLDYNNLSLQEVEYLYFYKTKKSAKLVKDRIEEILSWKKGKIQVEELFLNPETNQYQSFFETEKHKFSLIFEKEKDSQKYIYLVIYKDNDKHKTSLFRRKIDAINFINKNNGIQIYKHQIHR